MLSLAAMCIFLIIIQKAISVIFSDFPYASIFLQQIFGIFLPAYVLYEISDKKRYIEKKDFRLKKQDIPILLFAGFFMQLFGAFLNYPIILLLSELNIKAPNSTAIPDGSAIFLYIILICVIPAFTEEIFFRKIAFSKLLKYGKTKALIITSLLFGIIHFNPYSLIPLTIAGFLLTYTVSRGFSVIYAVILHFSLNFSGIILDFITKNEKASEIINNHFLLFGFFSGFLIFAFVIYIKKRSEEEHQNA